MQDPGIRSKGLGPPVESQPLTSTRGSLAPPHEQPYGRPVDEQRQHRSCRKQQREPTGVGQLLVVGDRLVYDAVLGRGGSARSGRAGARGRGLTRGGACSRARRRGACSGGSVPGCRTRRGSRGSVCSGWAACRRCGVAGRGARGLTCSAARGGPCCSAGRRATSAAGHSSHTCGPTIIQLRQAKEDLILGYVADLIGEVGGRILDFLLADAVLLVVEVLVDEDDLYLAAVVGYNVRTTCGRTRGPCRTRRRARCSGRTRSACSRASSGGCARGRSGRRSNAVLR